MSVSFEEVLRISKLARLEIDESELVVVQKKFNAILEYFNFLEEADTDAVEPLFHAAEKMELRSDEVEAPLNRDELLANAPEQFENCFKLPRVVGEAE